MPSKVYFASVRVPEYDYAYSFVGKFEEILKKVDLGKYIDKDEYVAIKTHLGSEGAHRIVRPIFLRKVADEVKRVGGKPFVTDTVRIPGLEYLEIANMHGLNHLSLGAPVILADGVFGNNVIEVEAGPFLGKIGVASAIYDAPAMIVVTHCKGHIGASYGGAIKNLGMGGLGLKDRHGESQRGKIHFMHNGNLTWHKEKCSYCQSCVHVCPHDSLHFDDDELIIDYDKCVKCGRCSRVCPNKAIEIPITDEVFMKSLVEGANAVIKTFKPGKILYINFITDIQPECDCMPLADAPVVPDIGVLVSDDIVAIETATLDMINNAERIQNSKAGDKGSVKGDNIFEKLVNKDPFMQINAAIELGMGNKEYEIIEVSKKES